MATSELSERAMENLRRNEEQRAKDSRYVDLKLGKIELNFNPEKIDIETSEYEGKPRIRYRYAVTDPRYPNNEKILAVPKTASEKIDKELRQGHRRLVIEREVVGGKTQYTVYPRD